MAETTNIVAAMHNFQPVDGCQKVARVAILLR